MEEKTRIRSPLRCINSRFIHYEERKKWTSQIYMGAQALRAPPLV